MRTAPPKTRANARAPLQALVLSFTASHLWPVRQDCQTSMAKNVNAESRRSPPPVRFHCMHHTYVMSQMAFAVCLLAGLAPVVSSMNPLLFMDMEDVATVPPTWGKLIPRANTLQAQPQVNSKQLDRVAMLPTWLDMRPPHPPLICHPPKKEATLVALLRYEKITPLHSCFGPLACTWARA